MELSASHPAGEASLVTFCCSCSAYALRIFLDKFGIASGVLTGVLPVASRQQLIHVGVFGNPCAFNAMCIASCFVEFFAFKEPQPLRVARLRCRPSTKDLLTF